MGKGYSKVNKELLLNSKEEFSSDLYLSRPNQTGQKEYVLFARGGLINKALEKIRNVPIGGLFIRSENWGEYAGIVEKNLDKVLKDQSVPLNKKSKVLYDVTEDVMGDIFDDPRSGENIQRSKNSVGSLVEFALSEPGAIKSLFDIGQKDYYTFSHCVQVSVFSVGLGKALGMKIEHDLYELGLGTLLHDVGKALVDINLLNKPDKLTPKEFEEIKKHTLYGKEILGDTVPAMALDIITHHHERVDGTGYPHRLKAGSIHEYAEIAIVADVYDALTTNRVYAKARRPFDAIAMMRKEMLGHFNSGKLGTFIKMLGPQFNI